MTNQQIFDKIINPCLIEDTLDYGHLKATNKGYVEQILAKAEQAGGLTLQESATLLALEEPSLLQKLYDTAGKVKDKIYGNRVVLFAPLYLSNYCVNGCTYCGYQYGNKAMKRLKLTSAEIKTETLALLQLGHKRLVLESGEDPTHLPIDYILEAIHSVYSVDYKGLNIRRININIAATSTENFKRLHQAEIGTYILFQESYHEETYKKMHPTGPKNDMVYHTSAMNRAMAGGIDDVGLGALFGLYDYKYEALSLLHHAHCLEEDCGVGPHTVSVPRLKKAEAMTLADYPYALSDEDFFKLIAVLRLSLPYTGMIMSTRETKELRSTALKLGISQISAGSNTGVGGYRVYKEEETAQFEVSDERSPVQVTRSLCEEGYLPSFCTACYRQGRTGDRFMEIVKAGEINKVCIPNALITLKEFALDFDNLDHYKAFIAQQLNQIDNPTLKTTIEDYLTKLDQGQRDFFV